VGGEEKSVQKEKSKPSEPEYEGKRGKKQCLSSKIQGTGNEELSKKKG